MNEQGNSYAESSVKVVQRHRNLDQEIVEITIDRLRLRLQAHLPSIEKQNAWKGDLGILLSLLLAVMTSDFKKVLDVEPGVWKSLFIIGSIVYFGKFIISLVKFFKSKNIDDLISAIKTDQANTKVEAQERGGHV